MRKQYILIAFCAVFVFTFVWEYTCLEHGWPNKPSKFFKIGSEFIQEQWENLGYLFAKISALFTWIKLEKVFQALSDLLEPLVEIILSPVYFIKGYVDTANLYDHPYMVGIGSFVLLMGIGYVLTRFGIHSKVWKVAKIWIPEWLYSRVQQSLVTLKYIAETPIYCGLPDEGDTRRKEE